MVGISVEYEEERFARWQQLKNLHAAGDWRAAIDLLQAAPPDPLLLWLRPTISWLHQLAKTLIDLRVRKVVSIGCGCGLLEWLLSAASSATSGAVLEVVGVEVNRSWWESRRAPPNFTPLIFPDEEQKEDLGAALSSEKEFAMLFCYFNDSDAFEGYIQRFGESARAIVIAGPTPGGGVHCQPAPLDDVLKSPWKRISLVRMPEDYGGHMAAVYTKPHEGNRHLLADSENVTCLKPVQPTALQKTLKKKAFKGPLLKTSS